MPQSPFGAVFGPGNFPPHKDRANEETKTDELYPKSLQDEVNDYYYKDKVLPRTKGLDFTEEVTKKPSAEGEAGSHIMPPPAND